MSGRSETHGPSDVIIPGTGIVGSALAAILARSGASVLMIDPASGNATGASSTRAGGCSRT